MASAKRVSTFLPDFFDHQGFFNTIGPVVVNVKETEGAFYVDLIVPGFSKENFTLRINNGILEVNAKRNVPGTAEESKMFNIDRACYERTFNLPTNTDENDIHARFESGILKLTIAKKEGTPSQSARTIEIA